MTNLGEKAGIYLPLTNVKVLRNRFQSHPTFLFSDGFVDIVQHALHSIQCIADLPSLFLSLAMIEYLQQYYSINESRNEVK